MVWMAKGKSGNCFNEINVSKSCLIPFQGGHFTGKTTTTRWRFCSARAPGQEWQCTKVQVGGWLFEVNPCALTIWYSSPVNLGTGLRETEEKLALIKGRTNERTTNGPHQDYQNISSNPNGSHSSQLPQLAIIPVNTLPISLLTIVGAPIKTVESFNVSASNELAMADEFPFTLMSSSSIWTIRSNNEKEGGGWC